MLKITSFSVLKVILLGASLFAGQAFAQAPPALDKEIRTLVAKHPAMLNYKTSVEYVDPRIKVPDCPGGYEIELPTRTRLWGRVNIPVRCNKGAKWFVSLPVKIQVFGQYLVSSRQIQGNSRLSQGDFVLSEGDLSDLPDGFVQKPEDALGRQVIRPIAPGNPIFLNNLRESSVIRVGDQVKVKIVGSGFEAAGSGVAQSGGSSGDSVKVKMPDGQALQGKVIGPSTVEIKIN
ncbi:flagellar basal body P-ring formation chaperone FlgA [Polynucleobacter corsicus]|uniref:flagellar basal body P-ring formation chaperone FlgA n=1 Tax=Polynucleobacter corsicus TaxID=2081042 RepID=UPI001BFE666B|nr:flagellar basal body P-ring formation chaperone FlgA [Polynucleobacter corsicus]QWE19297.1 flagellar basal body P-ring formation protein FlgA [Polynucleobacter corsicus]